MRAFSWAGITAALLCAPAAHGQVSNPSLATASDQPERIQPAYPERGVDALPDLPRPGRGGGYRQQRAGMARQGSQDLGAGQLRVAGPDPRAV